MEYHYESKLDYYTIGWETIEFIGNIMEMHWEPIGLDLLKFNEIARGGPYENQLEYYKIGQKNKNPIHTL